MIYELHSKYMCQYIECVMVVYHVIFAWCEVISIVLHEEILVLNMNSSYIIL